MNTDWGGIEEGEVAHGFGVRSQESEKEEFLPTDLHGLARIEEGEIGLSVMGYAVLPLSY
ncbi:hypothetical protein B9H02_08630 [Prosthecochloris sp. HL-130-GSB]|nr:hypothetical protein B9H02_08630 [Prosthecochloris sp. HL-130-GSB]